MRLGISEQTRRIAARSTESILRTKGSELGMFAGCGYPKSGTVWLCQVLSTALGVPYPREYRTPVAMASIIHGHWRYDPKFPNTAYIRRDGRDIMVSLYFYYVRALSTPGKPRRAHQLREMFQTVYGSGFDPGAASENLPKFIERMFASPRGSAGLAWPQHVEDWWDRPQVTHVSYEEMLAEPETAVKRLVQGLTGEEANEEIVRHSVARWNFATTTQRKHGEEDRQSFQRKGVAGDWRNYFTREAGEVFHSHAGDALVQLEYEQDEDWYRSL